MLWFLSALMVVVALGLSAVKVLKYAQVQVTADFGKLL